MVRQTPKAAPFAGCFQQKEPFQLIPPEGGMSRSDRGDTLKGWRAAQLRRCLRQKQPKRSRGSGLPFARAQRRPKQKQGTATRGVRYKQCGGQPYSRPPQRDPIFRDAKVLLFWCDQQQKEYGSIPLCRHIGWVFYPSVQVVSGTRTPLISSPGMVPRGCYK